MTDLDPSPQARLANDIAVQFAHQSPDAAARAIAKHITMFWDPRMRADLQDILKRSPESLHPLAQAAAKLLQPSPTPQAQGHPQ